MQKMVLAAIDPPASHDPGYYAIIPLVSLPMWQYTRHS